MARPSDVKVNFLAWYKEVFVFSDKVAKALYGEQLLKNKTTIAELSDNKIDSIICAIRRTLPIAEISAARRHILDQAPRPHPAQGQHTSQSSC